MIEKEVCGVRTTRKRSFRASDSTYQRIKVKDEDF